MVRKISAWNEKVTKQKSAKKGLKMAFEWKVHGTRGIGTKNGIALGQNMAFGRIDWNNIRIYFHTDKRFSVHRDIEQLGLCLKFRIQFQLSWIGETKNMLWFNYKCIFSIFVSPFDSKCSQSVVSWCVHSHHLNKQLKFMQSTLNRKKEENSTL